MVDMNSHRELQKAVAQTNPPSVSYYQYSAPSVDNSGNRLFDASNVARSSITQDVEGAVGNAPGPEATHLGAEIPEQNVNATSTIQVSSFRTSLLVLY
jgi:hypothetical protein